ncbi:putative pseudouridylate synthase [Ordospora colligata]|nr:putative pseudouridylate synthase [Ordospora colligata]
MEDEIAQIVTKLLDQMDCEMHSNKVYSIADRSSIGVNKEVLRIKLLSGDRSTTHTEIKIQVVVNERSSDLLNRSSTDQIRKNTMIFEYNNLIVDVSINVENDPIYIYGEYIKMSRSMTQTPLFIGKTLKCSRSVSDFCKQLKKFFCAGDVKFVPAGREDMDVQMIEGRPFLLVVKNPRHNLAFQDLELDLYKEVDIINLKVVKKECKEAIFSGEVISKKTYSLLVCSKHSIDIQKHYDVDQMTPLRVMHRRANMTREKKVDILEWKGMG